MQLQGRNLSVQMEGEDVKLLQRELRLLGFDILEDEVARTYFGRTTLEAVKAFQQRHNLEADGIVGERTAALINQELEGQQPPPPQLFVVKGQVVHVDGRPVGNSIVRAFDVRLRTADVLGETTADPQGNYEIRYSPEQFQRDG
jgi:peptidoglycan hydrolase-like protein with peptidoglycan-binding domain